MYLYISFLTKDRWQSKKPPTESQKKEILTGFLMVFENDRGYFKEYNVKTSTWDAVCIELGTR